MKNALLTVFSAALCLAAFRNAVADTVPTAPDSSWLRGGYGIMVHWLFPEYSERNVDALADGFDVGRFMADFDRTGAGWLIFTVGQNNGCYAAPNATIDGYAGDGHCARRDLVGEIAAAVHARGKKFIAYLPCELNSNVSMHRAFGWPTGTDVSKDMSTFESRWLEVIREWSGRWGRKIDGWWIDGYAPAGTHWPCGISDESKWEDALRAGNPAAVIAFNSGEAATSPQTGAGLADFLAGEIASMNQASDWPRSEFVSDGGVPTSTRIHVLTPIDGYWGAFWEWPRRISGLRDEMYSSVALETHEALGGFPQPNVSQTELASFIVGFTSANAAVTINVGINRAGRLNPHSVGLLDALDGSTTPATPLYDGSSGVWSAAPMTADGSAFSTEGEMVFAFVRDCGDPGTTRTNFSASVPFNLVNTMTDTITGVLGGGAVDGVYGDGRQPGDFIAASPAFTGDTDGCGDEGFGKSWNSFGSILSRAWTGYSTQFRGTSVGKATFTLKNLTVGRKYLVQFFLHESGASSKCVMSPDPDVAAYCGGTVETTDDWKYGGVLTGRFAARETEQDVTLTFPNKGDCQLNAVQLRCLGQADDEAGAAANAMSDTSCMKGVF